MGGIDAPFSIAPENMKRVILFDYNCYSRGRPMCCPENNHKEGGHIGPSLQRQQTLSLSTMQFTSNRTTLGKTPMTQKEYLNPCAYQPRCSAFLYLSYKILAKFHASIKCFIIRIPKLFYRVINYSKSCFR